jgi:hypothetical protein
VAIENRKINWNGSEWKPHTYSINCHAPLFSSLNVVPVSRILVIYGVARAVTDLGCKAVAKIEGARDEIHPRDLITFVLKSILKKNLEIVFWRFAVMMNSWVQELGKLGSFIDIKEFRTFSRHWGLRDVRVIQKPLGDTSLRGKVPLVEPFSSAWQRLRSCDS